MTLEALVRRDHAIVGAGLAGLAILAWPYVVRVAHAMSDLDMHAVMGMAGPRCPAGTSPTGSIRGLPLVPTLR